MNSPSPSAPGQSGLPTRPWPVRTLLACLVLACLLPGLIGAGVLIVRQYHQNQAQLGMDRVRTARALVQAVDGYFLRARSVGETLATDESIARGDLERFRWRAREVLARTGIGANVILVDEGIRQVFNLLQVPGTPLPYSTNPDGIRRVFASGKPVVSDLMPGPMVKRPVTAVHVPVEVRGRIAYVLSVGILPEQFGEILAAQNLPADWVTAIFDAAGTTVARSRGTEGYIGQKGAADLISHTREFPEGIVDNTTREGIPVVNAYSRSSLTGWTVALGIPREAVEAPLAGAFSALFIGIAGIFAIGLALAWFIGGKIARSFRALVPPAAAIGSGGALSLPPMAVKEAAELAKALGDAAALLERRTADLRRSEIRLRILTDHSPAAIAVFDREMRYLAVSQRWREEFCPEEKGLVGRSHYEVFPDIPEDWKEAHRRGMAGEVLQASQDRFERGDGSVRWVRWGLWPWHEESGAVGGIAIAGEDITARREAEEQLRVSEEKYRTLFSNMTEGFFLGEPVFDGQGRPVDFRFLEVNEAFYVETGLPEGIVGRPARECLPRLEQSWIDLYNGVALTGRSVRRQNFNADTRRHYDLHAFCPTPGRFAVVFRDITENKRVEAQLMERETYLRQLVATLPGMVWTCAPDGALEFVSQQWLDYTGTSLDSQLGTGGYAAIHPEDRERTRALWLAAVAEEAPFTIEYRLCRHDGQYRWFKSRGAPFRGGDGRITRWLGVIIDIDDLKQAEAALAAARQTHLAHLEQQVAERTAALQEARDQLEKRVAERTGQVRRLAADITFAEERERQAIARDLHDDLGQLLHVVKIKLEMLAREVEQPRARSLVTETGALVSDASRQVRSLTSQLSPPVLSTLGLPAALGWLCGEIRETYGLAVACRAEPAHGGLSAAQNAILFRAARELLINAAKHSGSRQATLDLVREEGSLILAVADSGNGSPVRAESLAGAKGFGLASIRERISFLGGTTALETPPGGGVRVTLRLPLEAGDERAGAPREAAPPQQGPEPVSEGSIS